MKSLPPRYWLSLACSLTLTTVSFAGGCRNGQFLSAPGPLNYQQARAVVHDPYPARDIAPYDAASRPPGYEQPLPEPVRNRMVKDSMPWLGR